VVRASDRSRRRRAYRRRPGEFYRLWIAAPHEAPLSANEPALTSAVDCVAAAVDVARDAGVPPERVVGVPPERVVLVGVWQGDSVAAGFLRRRPRRYGGAFVVSAALPGDGHGLSDAAIGRIGGRIEALLGDG
jgi:phospholipase/carboxylesterase